MASKSKIYMVLEFVDGGELFNKIVRLKHFLCLVFSLPRLWMLLFTCFF
jgi:hypothetical protein